ncbi:MAG TPA: hypothetical protein VLV86_10825 [Vicinamibacterales bacterium]|nr:hypothetical protein [Vicinamibacterales bacterium]
MSNSDEALSPDMEFDVATLDDEEYEPLTEYGGSNVTPDVEFDLAVLAGEDVDVSHGVNLAANPAFRQALSARVAQQHPLLGERGKNLRQRQFDFATGAVWAPAGAQTVITINPQCLFRCEKVMATDTGSVPGMGTSIVQVAIGQKIQRPGNAGQGTLTQFFAETSLANGIRFDTAHAWEAIAITVSFNETCTFNMNLWGTVEID